MEMRDRRCGTGVRHRERRAKPAHCRGWGETRGPDGTILLLDLTDGVITDIHPFKAVLTVFGNRRTVPISRRNDPSAISTTAHLTIVFAVIEIVQENWGTGNNFRGQTGLALSAFRGRLRGPMIPEVRDSGGWTRQLYCDEAVRASNTGLWGCQAGPPSSH